MTTITEYLAMMAGLQKQCGRPEARVGWMYDSYEAMVLAEGREFTTNPRPKGVRQRKMKHCYGNATEFVLRDTDRYVYCEGYATNMLTTLHAWVFDRETGELIDPTWKQQETNVYYGIEFPFPFVMFTLEKAGTYGVIGNDYLFDCQMLKEGGVVWRSTTAAKANS